MKSLHEQASIELGGEFTVTKNHSIENVNNVFSCSLFNMPDSYKDSSIYYSGINKIVSYITENLNNSILLVYYDHSIMYDINNKRKEVLENLCTSACVCMVKYNFPKFQTKVNVSPVDINDDEFKGTEERYYHSGLFGTFVRMVPLFDFGKLDASVYLIDIDFEVRNVANYISALVKYNDLMKEKDVLFYNKSYGCFSYGEGKDRIKTVPGYDFRLNIQCIYRKRLPKQILIDCLESIHTRNNHWAEYNVYRQKTYKKFDVKKNKKKTIDWNQQFQYGLDEWFVNYYIPTYLMQTKQKLMISFSRKIRGIDYQWTMSTLTNKFTNITIEQKEILQQMYRTILKKDFSENISENFNKVDAILYNPNGKKLSKFTSTFNTIDNILIKTFDKHFDVMFNEGDAPELDLIRSIPGRGFIIIIHDFDEGHSEIVDKFRFPYGTI